MKRKILLVDGYNMIAFWQETRQLFQKSELDAARNILLQKLSPVSYTHLDVDKRQPLGTWSSWLAHRVFGHVDGDFRGYY